MRADVLREDDERGDQSEDDRRVAEREPGADGQGALAVVEELPRGVVDRGDMVGVESVPESEDVRRDREPGEDQDSGSRLLRIVVRKVRERADEGEESGDADPREEGHHPEPLADRQSGGGGRRVGADGALHGFGESGAQIKVCCFRNS